jgi:3-methyladenine DNA glycosylase AlkC
MKTTMGFKARPTFSLKDQLFNPAKVAMLAERIAAVYPRFQTKSFIAAVLAPFPTLELKARITHIATELHNHLPKSFNEASALVVASLPAPLDPNLSDNDFGDFIYAPLSEFIANQGCNASDVHTSLQALAEITQRFSAEYALRPFINAFTSETFSFLKSCTGHSNYHVRRLASEGSRPKLPWGIKIQTSPQHSIDLLDSLYGDSKRFVTRSVANHLNDLSKTDPDLVLTTLKRWAATDKQDSDEMNYITRHSVRTLIKQSNRGALSLLGYGNKPKVDITAITMHTPHVPIGDSALFSIQFVSREKQALLIEYALQHSDAPAGKGLKVFKLKTINASPNQRFDLRKKHPMKAMTTRQLYPGVHTLSLRMNGQPLRTLEFSLHA